MPALTNEKQSYTHADHEMSNNCSTRSRGEREDHASILSKICTTVSRRGRRIMDPSISAPMRYTLAPYIAHIDVHHHLSFGPIQLPSASKAYAPRHRHALSNVRCKELSPLSSVHFVLIRPQILSLISVIGVHLPSAQSLPPKKEETPRHSLSTHPRPLHPPSPPSPSPIKAACP